MRNGPRMVSSVSAFYWSSDTPGCTPACTNRWSPSRWVSFRPLRKARCLGSISRAARAGLSSLRAPLRGTHPLQQGQECPKNCDRSGPVFGLKTMREILRDRAQGDVRRLRRLAGRFRAHVMASGSLVVRHAVMPDGTIAFEVDTDGGLAAMNGGVVELL